MDYHNIALGIQRGEAEANRVLALGASVGQADGAPKRPVGIEQLPAQRFTLRSDHDNEAGQQSRPVEAAQGMDEEGQLSHGQEWLGHPRPQAFALAGCNNDRVCVHDKNKGWEYPSLCRSE